MIKKKVFEIEIYVYTFSKQQKIEFENNILNIYIKENQYKNKANKSVIKLLEKILKTKVKIISSFKKKIIIADKNSFFFF
ncbi:MAG: hypothetical protein B6U87_00110 [Candidatus Aenigmarchaeota archaeon ex4484_52]|nr:MAG: hypothetical protein B6U87_00110 [Candidatus Aenigmarchaeota archaeon ex4484_52]